MKKWSKRKSLIKDDKRLQQKSLVGTLGVQFFFKRNPKVSQPQKNADLLPGLWWENGWSSCLHSVLVSRRTCQTWPLIALKRLVWGCDGMWLVEHFPLTKMELWQRDFLQKRFPNWTT